MKDFCLNSDSVTLNTERELIIQQIDMLFDTDNNEVLGEYNYGTDFRQFLWDMKKSNNDISNYTRSVIMSNVDLFGWTLDVDTTLLHGTNNDIILVSITISKNLTNFEKTYMVK